MNVTAFPTIDVVQYDNVFEGKKVFLWYLWLGVDNVSGGIVFMKLPCDMTGDLQKMANDILLLTEMVKGWGWVVYCEIVVDKIIWYGSEKSSQ